MSVGWFSDLDDAKEYFEHERLETEAWDNLDNTKMTKLINQAYNRIYYNPDYSIPTYALATAAQLVKLRVVNAEMAYYLAQHLGDEDRRMGLRAQGVIKAGIVKEEYKKEMELPIPPFIDAILEDEGFGTAKAFGMVDIDRDENKSVDEKVDDF